MQTTEAVVEQKTKGVEAKPVNGSLRFELRPSGAMPADWDKFAHCCNASFRSAFRAAFLWQVHHHIAFHLRRYDIFSWQKTSYVKVGQFALGFGPTMRVFDGTLHLLPEYQQSWSAVMRIILKHLGPGRYIYGSDWTTEPSRAEELRRVLGVAVLQTKNIDLYAVDFSDYSTWLEYYKAISKNARRNEVASLQSSNQVITCQSRIRYFRDSVFILFSKRDMFKKKGLKPKTIKFVMSTLTRYIVLRPYIFTSRNISGEKTLSAFLGVRFGKDLYYLEGASVEKPGGAAWHLLISMLRLAYEESRGSGKCILGPDDGSERDQIAWENLRRQRLQCVARPFPTSIVTFSYSDFDAGD